MAPVRHLATMAAAAAAAAAVALLLLVAGPGAEAGADTSNCRVAQIAFGDCADYVADLEGARLTPRCCRGLGIIRDLATTGDQRRELCECVHTVQLAAGSVDHRRAQHLRTACGFRVDFLPTSYYFNCSRIPDVVS